jgi:hypothetical protein
MSAPTSPPEFQDKRPRPSWMPRIASMDCDPAYMHPDQIPASGDGKIYPQQNPKDSNKTSGDTL